MNTFDWSISDLRFQLRLKQERIEALESDEEYVRLKEHFQHELAYQDKIIRDLNKTVAELKRQITENRKNWEQVHDDIIAETDKKLEEKDRIIAEKDQRIAELEHELETEKAKFRETKAELYAAQTQITDANEHIAALEARLNKDFTNSSKPSSQSPDHKTIPNSRVKSGRKPGAQPGHEHHGRKRQENPKVVVLPAPRQVLENPGQYELTGKEIRKQLISARLVVEATDYVAQEYRNILTGETVYAKFPTGMVDDVEYDSTVKAMAFMLNEECNVSLGKTHQFLFDASNGLLDLSTGAICNFTREFSAKSKEDREEIKNSILASDVIHADFTFGRKQGKMSSVLIMTDGDSVAYVSVSAKGNAGVQESGLDTYNGTMVSDHETAFIRLNCKHQDCMAHTLRYGIGSTEIEPNLKWNKLFIDWNRRAIAHWHLYDPNTSDQWKTKSEILIQEFHSILKTAKEEYECEPPGKYNKEGFNLYQRMEASPEDYVRFLRDPTVQPTNNIAEQKGRVYKRKAHQVMCFRGAHGEEYYCDALTILQTARMNGRNVYNEVIDIFDTLMVRQRRRSRTLRPLQRMKAAMRCSAYMEESVPST